MLLELLVIFLHHRARVQFRQVEYHVKPIPRLLFGDQLMVARAYGAAVL